MAQQVFSGVASGMLSNLLIKAAHVYKTPAEALMEYLQNAADEPLTRRIWVHLDRPSNRILIGDDGSGMGGRMPPDDDALVELYYQAIANNEDPGCDLREIVTESAMHTLEWLIRNIANSMKGEVAPSDTEPNKKFAKQLKAMNRQPHKRQRRSTMGKFGIGAWAFLSFATDLAISSRPNRELAENLGITDEDQVYTIIPPNKAKLIAHQLGYQLIPESDGLADLFGKELEHGTVVTISGVTEMAWEELSVKILTDYFRDTFGSRIESTGLEITVSDHTKKIEKVPPQVIRGRIILESSFKSLDGTECSVLLHYDRKARNLIPRVTKLGVTICGLNEIRGKNQQTFSSPWDSGRLGGYIAFEHEQGDDDLFDTSKHGILITPELHHWAAQLKKFEPDLKRAIEKIEKEAEDDRLNQSSELLNSVLQSALSNQGISFRRPELLKDKGGEGKPRAERQPRKLEHIIVQVVDKNGRGVSGVTVTLEGPHNTWQRLTGISGSIQFGWPIPGKYKVSIQTEIPVQGQSSVKFDIDHQNGVFGKRAKFVLETGDEQQKLTSPEIEVSFNSWDDPDEPWRQSINNLSVIEFNINEYSALRKELDAEHYVIVDALMAEYTTSAIMEALAETSTHAGRVRQSNLYAEVYTRLQDARNEGTRAARKQKAQA